MKRDLYQEVTDQIIKALEQGVAPWVKPWHSGDASGPSNAVTHRAYRGINVLLLTIAARAAGYERDEWATFKQALAAGAPVRKGEKATRIYFYKPVEIKGNKPTPDDENLTNDPRTIPMLREYYVFNVAQLEGELPGRKPLAPLTFVGEPELDGFIDATGAQFRHGGDQAFYSPSFDFIQMPRAEAFRTPADYYATKLHELTHWTGHKSRCDRLEKGARFGDQAYAFEELVAEIGSAFLVARFGIEGKLQHASYVANWIKVLRDDKRAIFRAASLAQKAADFLNGLAEGKAEADEAIAA